MTLGRQKGFAASLFTRLEYLWSSCSGPVSAQSDLYRLTYAIEQLKSQDWVNAVVSDEDWDNEALLVQEYSDTDVLLVRKSALIHGFSDEGKLVAPVEFMVTGDLSACTEVFQAYALPSVMMASNRIASCQGSSPIASGVIPACLKRRATCIISSQFLGGFNSRRWNRD